MQVSKGDRVKVNLAPFIGSAMPSDEWIDCQVLDVEGVHVLVATEPPYRRVELWVLSTWIKAPARTHSRTSASTARV